MMASRSFCGMSPCMADTVKLFCRIFSVSQSTFRLVLQKMTACGANRPQKLAMLVGVRNEAVLPRYCEKT